MPTYTDYLMHCAAKKIQAMPEQTYSKLVRCGFNPLTNKWS